MKTATPSELKQVAAAVRAACLAAARAGYEQAAFDGLCHEGAVENSLSAMQKLDLDVLIRDLTQQNDSANA